MAQDTSAYTNLIGAGWAVNGAPLIPGGGTIPLSGHYVFVNSVTGSDGNQGTYDSPVASTTQAQTLVSAGIGDCIVWQAGHAETISAAGGITVSKAGIYMIGLGTGANRPTFTFSAAASTFLISSANVAIGNILGVSGVDLCVSPFSITAAGCSLGMPNLPVEYQDPDSSNQAIRVVLGGTGADKLNINLIYRGITSGGTSPVNVVRLNGTNNGVINCDFYGRASTAMVEFVTTACTGIEIYGYMYNSGVTNYTKDVVDTATSSTWFASFSDGAAGFDVSGGSGSALGPAQAATVIADLAVGTADATTNALERDVIGNKTDAAVTAVGTTKSLAAYAKGHTTMLTVQTADSSANAFMGDVIGNKTDAGVQTVGTTGSNTAYTKGILDQLSGAAGITTFPAAAAAANAVSIAEVIRYISELQVPRVAIKTIASASSSLTTGASPVTLFTVTGDVMVRVWATVQTGLTSTATTGTLEVGVSGNTAGLLPQVVANGTNFPTGAVWVDVTPTLKMEAFAAANTNWAPIAGSANITCVVGTNSMTAGAITFYCQYLPCSVGSSVVAA